MTLRLLLQINVHLPEYVFNLTKARLRRSPDPFADVAAALRGVCVHCRSRWSATGCVFPAGQLASATRQSRFAIHIARPRRPSQSHAKFGVPLCTACLTKKTGLVVESKAIGVYRVRRRPDVAAAIRIHILVHEHRQQCHGH